jgi:hypothetical protein
MLIKCRFWNARFVVRAAEPINPNIQKDNPKVSEADFQAHMKSLLESSHAIRDKLMKRVCRMQVKAGGPFEIVWEE